MTATPGSIDNPLATLTAARDKAREYRKSNGLPCLLKLLLLPGEYFMFQPLLLTAEDSGTSDSPLTFKAEEGKK